MVDSRNAECLTLGLSFRYFPEEHQNSGLLARHMHGCLPLDKSSCENALGVADRMWASWTLTRSFAEDVDDGLVDCEEIDDKIELGDLAELQAEGTTESPSRETVDERS